MKAVDERGSAGTQQSGDTMRHPADRAAARSRLVEIIARQLINQTIQERHESLPVRPIQH